MAEVHVPTITALYAALQALVAIGLVVPVGQLRARTNVPLGSGGNPQLEVAIRRHANWAEHVPFELLLMALLELNGGSAALLHGLGLVLLAARVVHPFGLKADTMRVPARGIGAFATMLVTLVAAIALLWRAL